MKRTTGFSNASNAQTIFEQGAVSGLTGTTHSHCVVSRRLLLCGLTENSKVWGSTYRILMTILLTFALSSVTYATGHWVFDDFEDGDAMDGYPFTWLIGAQHPDNIPDPDATQVVMGGDYVITTTGNPRAMVFETVNATGDVSVQTQLRFLYAGQIGANAGLYARGAIDGRTLYFAGINGVGQVFLGELKSTLVDQQTLLNPFEQDITLRLDIVGNALSVKAWPSDEAEPSAPLLSLVDNTLTSGAVGVWANGVRQDASFAFRDFGVRGLQDTSVPRDHSLSWEPGEKARTFDVYFGTDFNDVSSANRDNPQGVLVSQDQDTSTYDPEESLNFGQKYYWRVDEIGPPPDYLITPGGLNTFSVEPIARRVAHVVATDSGNLVNRNLDKLVNGSGLNVKDEHSTEEADMWVLFDNGMEPAWVQFDFDKVYKLHEMVVWNYNGVWNLYDGRSYLIRNWGFRDVTVEYSMNGAEWTVLGDVEFTRASGTSTYKANTTVDFNGTVAQFVRLTPHTNWYTRSGVLRTLGLSEVRFFAIPTYAREPQPVDEETEVPTDVTLHWQAGREAEFHEVYLSTDRLAILEGTAPVEIVFDNSFDPGSLDPGTTYYWKITGFNETESPSFWEGEIWQFTTGTGSESGR